MIAKGRDREEAREAARRGARRDGRPRSGDESLVAEEVARGRSRRRCPAANCTRDSSRLFCSPRLHPLRMRSSKLTPPLVSLVPRPSPQETTRAASFRVHFEGRFPRHGWRVRLRELRTGEEREAAAELSAPARRSRVTATSPGSGSGAEAFSCSSPVRSRRTAPRRGGDTLARGADARPDRGRARRLQHFPRKETS